MSRFFVRIPGAILISFLCWLWPVADLFSGEEVVINEVLANVPGVDSGSGSPGDRFEFIELYNTGEYPVDLSGWSIDDGDARDDIIPWTGLPLPWEGAVCESSLLPAGCFALVLDPENPVPEPAFPYHVPESTLVVTVGNTTLGDGLSTTDPVTLRDADDHVVDTFGTPGLDDDFPFDPGDGISMERKDPDEGDYPENWAHSMVSQGATPGDRNSVTRAVDAMIPAGNPSLSRDQISAGETIEITCSIHNFGQEAFQGCPVFFSASSGLFPSFDEVAVFDTAVIGRRMESGDSAVVKTSWTGTEQGLFSFLTVVDVDGDAYPENDTALARVRVGNPLTPVVINEIYAWRVGEESQWVEIFNAGMDLIDISGWGVRDESGTAGTISGHNVFLAADDHLVLVSDAAGFEQFYNGVPSFAYEELSGFPVLNRNGDSVVLCDERGTVVDSVRYGGAPEDGVGVSWERVNPGVHSFLAANWARSLDTGGTPGRRNSVAMDRVPHRGRLVCTPPVITPDGDGLNDRTTISYRIPCLSSDVTVKIFDSQGVEVAVVAEGLRVPGEGSFLWDGKGTDGNVVPTGLYILLFEAHNGPSGEKFLFKRSLVCAGAWPSSHRR